PSSPSPSGRVVTTSVGAPIPPIFPASWPRSLAGVRRSAPSPCTSWPFARLLPSLRSVRGARRYARARSRTLASVIGASRDSQPCASHRPHRRNVTVEPPTFIRISMSEPFAHDGQRIPASQWSQYVPDRGIGPLRRELECLFELERLFDDERDGR